MITKNRIVFSFKGIPSKTTRTATFYANFEKLTLRELHLNWCTAPHMHHEKGKRPFIASIATAAGQREGVTNVAAVLSTVWGGKLLRRFRKMFSESSTMQWAVLATPMLPMQARAALEKKITKPSEQVAAPDFRRGGVKKGSFMEML